MRDSRVSTAALNIEANAVGAALSNGYLRVYGGVKPANIDDATLEPVLAVLRFAETAFNPAVGGLILSLPLVPDLNTAGGGDATWFSASTVDGDVLFDGTVGKAGGEEQYNLAINESTTVHPGGELHIGSVSYKVKR